MVAWEATALPLGYARFYWTQFYRNPVLLPMKLRPSPGFDFSLDEFAGFVNEENAAGDQYDQPDIFEGKRGGAEDVLHEGYVNRR